MCIAAEDLLELCDLFPQTAENIKRRSLERRHRFVKEKNNNSKKYRQSEESRLSNNFQTGDPAKSKRATPLPPPEEELEEF